MQLFEFGIGRSAIVQHANGITIFLVQCLNVPLARSSRTRSKAVTSLKDSMAALKSPFWYSFWPRWCRPDAERKQSYQFLWV
jgi:hypothetical protein